MPRIAANRPLKRARASAWLLGLAAFGAWLGAVYAQRPAATYRRAEQAMDADRVEPLQYDLVGLRSHRQYEPQASLLSGKLLLAEGRCDAALEVLSLAIDDPATEPRGLTLAGEALFRVGRFLDAGEAWTRVLALDPANFEALRWLGIAYNDLGAIPEARHYLQRAADADPTDPGALRLDGLLAKDTGEFGEAITAFKESLRREPTQPDADLLRFEIAECQHSLSHDEEALQTLSGCSATAEVLTLQAHIAFRLGRSEEAWRCCTQATQLDPRQVKALLLEAKMSVERRDPRHALQCLEQALSANPASVQAHYQLALVWQRLGSEEKASEAGRRAAELTRLDERYQNLRDKAAMHPRDAGMRLELGDLAARLNMQADARRWFRAALYLEPENEVAIQSLSKLLLPPSPPSP